MTKQQIRKIFMDNGFTIKQGYSDLKPYVYKAARELVKAAQKEVAHGPSCSR